jgi:hypothetical protein
MKRLKYSAENKYTSCNGPYMAIRFSGGFPGWCHNWNLAVDLVHVNTWGVTAALINPLALELDI